MSEKQEFCPEGARTEPEEQAIKERFCPECGTLVTGIEGETYSTQVPGLCEACAEYEWYLTGDCYHDQDDLVGDG